MTNTDIKVLRIKLDLTQKAFAKELNVSIHTVIAWENKGTKPNERTLYKIEQLSKDLV